MSNNEISKKFFDVIPRAMRSVRYEMRTAASPTLTVPQFRVIVNINRGCNHICQIAELLGISQPALSKIVRGLVEKGFIEKTKSLTDGRSLELSLTEEGKKTFIKVRSKASHSFNSKIEKMSNKQLEEFSKSLDCLMNFMDNI